MDSSLVSSNWFRLLFPLVLLSVLGFGSQNVILVTEANLGIASSLPFVLFAAAIILAHTFKQSRIAMVATALLLTYWIIQTRLQVPLSVGTTMLEVSLAGFLVPVACLLSYAFNDRGLDSRSFGIYLVTLSLLLLWSYLIISHFDEGGFADFDDSFLFVVPELSRLPFVLVLYMIGLVASCAILVLRYNRIVDVVCYSSILLVSATLIFFHIPYISSTVFTLAGILLLLYLMSASHELAFKDRLTGISGRHALESDIRHLGRRYSIAMLDIDHFKSFNDTYGHDTGDDVLKLVAAKLTEVGGRAKVYRYGGEEFTVIFKGRHSDQAKEHLEELRQSIEEYELVIRNSGSRPTNDKQGSKQRGKKNAQKSVTITISIGVANNTHGSNPHEVIKVADQALYSAKKAGRNCVKFARKVSATA
ncbi:GGDEF domain-containing protein [Vibrio sp.]|uniref:GGDEF domain-containing protein n=1 Tax=Vibrio sp. TaxID=678 RepID=UPI003D0D2383